MKVMELVGPGLDGIRFAERREKDVPLGHVRLKLKAVSLNYRDLLIAKGSVPVTYPCIPLSDAVGEVVETGVGVGRVKVGDRVCPTYYPDWIDGTIATEKFARDRGWHGDGVAAEYLVLSEQELLHVPAHLSDAEASTLPCAAVTAWAAVTRHVTLRPGSTVLIQGTGGVSLFALQFALAAGAETFLISSDDEKLARAKALGAHHVLNYRANPQWGAAILEQSGGRGMELVVDVVGAGTLEQSVIALSNGGHISQVGVLGGFAASVSLYPLMTKEAHIDGIMSGSRDCAESMMRAITHQRLRPIVEVSRQLTDLPEALLHLEGQHHFGKVTLAIDH
ncbi:NADPH:quinone reductase [Variovorax sp. HW608]|uniref:zinc-dependent alcohol dehydrogenase family protein n=1 Tax=Variovorax sp. HW608 TaxID=1034889 RepID=UPI00082001C0|nr:NAD(P)-dependent alcohol dehydrogenase [Variovorax sp. HW608]SCK32391.1 NADPH:quinone reductase [Variovorax sp. HW608]